MRDISRRINTVEKLLSFGRHEKQIILMPPLITCIPTNPTGRNYEELGPQETWITYQEQLQAQKKANAELLKDNPNSLGMPIIIDTSVDEEYQARQRKTTKNN